MSQSDDQKGERKEAGMCEGMALVSSLGWGCERGARMGNGASAFRSVELEGLRSGKGRQLDTVVGRAESR